MRHHEAHPRVEQALRLALKPGLRGKLMADQQQLDGARASLQAADAADEAVATARFTIVHELDRAYGDLNREMDTVEERQAWEKLDTLRSAAEFAQAALERAEGLGATSGREDAAGGAALTADGDAGGGEDVVDDEAERAAEESEEEEDELDHLAQMVTRQAKWTTRGQRRARGGGGGGASTKGKGRA